MLSAERGLEEGLDSSNFSHPDVWTSWNFSLLHETVFSVL